MAIGHGKAILHLQRHGDAGLERILLEACLKNTLYDHQTDEVKSQYLADALIATGSPKEYLEKLISNSARIRTSRDNHQWAMVLAKLARHGIPGATEYIREHWVIDLRAGVGDMVDAYVMVDGEPAYREVLLFGLERWARRRKEISGAFSLHMTADDALGESRARRVRDRIAKRNPHFAKIADFPERYEQIRKERAKEPRPSVEDRIRDGMYVPGKLLTEEETLLVAKKLGEGLEGLPASRSLQAMSHQPFPLDIAILFKYLESDDPWIRNNTLAALGSNCRPEVRALAFQYCDDGYMRGEAIAVLRSNFEPGDEVWIEQQLRRPNDPFKHHNTVTNTLDVIKAVPKADWESILRHLLDTTACQICRGSAAYALRKRRLLSEEDLRYLSYDAYSNLRRDARKWLKLRMRPRAKPSETPT